MVIEMERNYIDIEIIEENGKLYRNKLMDTIEARIPNTPYKSCHAADLLELPGGDLLCCWFAGSDEGNADVSIVLSRLNADSSVWTEPVKVSDDSTRSEQNPSLFLTPEGDIWLMYTAQVARTPETEEGFNLQYTAEIRRKVSKDGGYTWGKTEVMFERPGSFCRQKIQVLSSGRFIFGNWICFSDDSRNGSDITVMQISDDKGVSWREVPVPESQGRVHANIVETKPGMLTAIFRSRFADHIYVSFSKDNGDSWSVPTATELLNNNSSISAIKLQSGAIGLVFNPVAFNADTKKTVWPDQRCPVTLAISEDGGVTWPYQRIIELGEGFTGIWNDINNGRYEYPVMMQGSDGNIHVAYSWGNMKFGKRKCIKYLCVEEAWIRGSKVCYGAENNPAMPCRR